jgi:hypothetical protein
MLVQLFEKLSEGLNALSRIFRTSSAPSPKSEIDFGMSGARLAPQNIPRESFEEFMNGSKVVKPSSELTLKDQLKMEMKKGPKKHIGS